MSRRLAGRDCDPGCCWSCAGWHSSYTGPWGRGVCLLQVTAASWGLPGSGTGEGLTLHQATAPSWPPDHSLFVNPADQTRAQCFTPVHSAHPRHNPRKEAC